MRRWQLVIDDTEAVEGICERGDGMTKQHHLTEEIKSLIIFVCSWFVCLIELDSSLPAPSLPFPSFLSCRYLCCCCCWCWSPCPPCTSSSQLLDLKAFPPTATIALSCPAELLKLLNEQ